MDVHIGLASFTVRFKLWLSKIRHTWDRILLFLLVLLQIFRAYLLENEKPPTISVPINGIGVNVCM